MAACGGGGGPTQQEFASEANAVCRRHTATIEQAASKVLGGGTLPSPEEFGRLAKGTIVPEVRGMFEELRAVEPPSGRKSEYEAFLVSGEDTLARVERDPALLQNPANFQDLNRQAEELGLSRACRVGPG